MVRSEALNILSGSLATLIATKTSQVEKNLEQSFAPCRTVKGISVEGLLSASRRPSATTAPDEARGISLVRGQGLLTAACG